MDFCNRNVENVATAIQQVDTQDSFWNGVFWTTPTKPVNPQKNPIYNTNQYLLRKAALGRNWYVQQN
jgi:hypothetical protein